MSNRNFDKVNIQEQLDRSDEAQEVITYVPKSIVRYGMTLIFIIVFFLIFFSWYVRYPDIISAELKLSSSNPPIDLVAPSSGKIILYKANFQEVKEGDVIAEILNSAQYPTIISAESEINQALEIIRQGNYDSSLNELSNLFSINENLGDLQEEYLGIKYYLLTEINKKNNSYFIQKLSSLNSQILTLIDINKHLSNQVQHLTLELELVEKTVEIDSQLFKSQSISLLKYNATKSKYLNKLQNLESQRSILLRNRMEVRELEDLKVKANLDFERDKEYFLVEMKRKLIEIKNSIDEWKTRYLIISSASGKISYSKNWGQNESIFAGQKFCTTVPYSEFIKAHMLLPVNKAGKAAVGLNVNIKVDSYPFNEYGTVEGLIESISLTPDEDFYFVEIKMINGLKTTYDKKIQFKQGMSGTGEIVIEDKRLIERIFINIKEIFSRS